MKNIFKIGSILLLSAFIWTSCSQDLDPHGTAKFEVKTVKDAEGFKNGLYAQLRSVAYGGAALMSDIQADEFNATARFGNNLGSFHTWNGLQSNDSDLTSVWTSYYNVIKNANLLLSESAKLNLNELTTTEKELKDQSKLLTQYRGAAFATRAYCYFNLALRFCEFYDVNDAASGEKYGLPIHKVFNPKAHPRRSTLKETYDFIKQDLDSAALYLEGISGQAGSPEFTIDAIKALQAQVAFYTSDYTKAIEKAETLVNAGTYKLYDSTVDQNALSYYWRYDEIQEDIVQLFVSNPNELSSTYGFYNGSPATALGEVYFTPNYLPTKATKDLFNCKLSESAINDSLDCRYRIYFQKQYVLTADGAGIADNEVSIFTKFLGNPLLSDGLTNYQQAPKLLRIAEMYLILAESAFHIGEEGTALKYFNALRYSRGYIRSTSLAGADLLEAIKLERQRELMGEGKRLLDLRRWKQDVVRGETQNTKYLSGVGENDFTNLKVTYGSTEPGGKDYRQMVWGIPYNEMLLNKGVAGQQNPGWGDASSK